ncbi:hypothetical protein ACQ4PT_025514 [Festuca glaucescens]
MAVPNWIITSLSEWAAVGFDLHITLDESPSRWLTRRGRQDVAVVAGGEEEWYGRAGERRKTTSVRDNGKQEKKAVRRWACPAACSFRRRGRAAPQRAVSPDLSGDHRSQSQPTLDEPIHRVVSLAPSPSLRTVPPEQRSASSTSAAPAPSHPTPRRTPLRHLLLAPLLTQRRPTSARGASAAASIVQLLDPSNCEMLTKGRRVAGRGEDMAAHYSFGPHEDDAIIKHRLLTRTTTTRGEPPLKKLQKKFMSFATEVEKDADNTSDCEKLYKAFLQEINTFELPLLKSKAVVDANLREKESFNELQVEIQRQILQAQTDIEDLKKQLEQSKIERQHKEECEAIRKLISLQPPRSVTEKLIADLEKEISNLEAESAACTRTLELRKKQFALLLHVVEELQISIEDEQRSIADELRAATEEPKMSIEEGSGGASDAMAVD